MTALADLELTAHPLTPRQHRACAQLLADSALADCYGVPDRIWLDSGHLTMSDLQDWGWSSGETVLLHVLHALVGLAPMPVELWAIDAHERRVVSECVATLHGAVGV